jgi:hypothetical protein
MGERRGCRGVRVHVREDCRNWERDDEYRGNSSQDCSSLSALAPASATHCGRVFVDSASVETGGDRRIVLGLFVDGLVGHASVS